MRHGSFTGTRVRRVVSRPQTFWRAAYAAVVVVTAGALLSLHVTGLGNTLSRWGPVLIVLVVIGLVAVLVRPGAFLDAGSGLLFLLVIGTYVVLFARRVPAPKVQTYYLYFDRYLYSEVLPAALVLGAIGLHLFADACTRLTRSARTEVAVAGRIAIAALLAVVVLGLAPQIDQTRHATKYRLFGHSYAALQSLDRITGGRAGSAVVYSGSKAKPVPLVLREHLPGVRAAVGAVVRSPCVRDTTARAGPRRGVLPRGGRGGAAPQPAGLRLPRRAPDARAHAIPR